MARRQIGWFSSAFGLCLSAALLTGSAEAQVLDPNLFNATTNTGVDDPPGAGVNFAASSAIGPDDPRDAFGNNDGPIEPTTFIFADGGAADNGNGILGDGGETVDAITWQTNQVVLLEGYEYSGSSDGPAFGFSRGTELVRFSVNGEVDDLYDHNSTTGGVQRLFAVPQVGNTFEVNTTRRLTTGPRVNEIDAIVANGLPASLRVAPIHFNATTNGAGDEAPGLGTNFAATSVLGGDTIEDAFGNNNGGVEPTSFLFADGGTPDNGNNTFDVGAETIDAISWNTTSALTLHGFRVALTPDGGGSTNRGSELVSFFIDGALVDTIDFNAMGATIDHLLPGGPVTGSSFRMEVTRSETSGPRVLEIDAILEQNQAPIAEANGDYVFDANNLSLSLSAAGSFDPENLPFSLDWIDSGGALASGSNPTISITDTELTMTTSTDVLSLTITDFENATDSDTATVRYANAGPQINSAGTTQQLDGSVDFSAALGDADLAVNGLLSGFEALMWEFDLSAAGSAGDIGDGFLAGSGTTAFGNLDRDQLLALFGGGGEFTAFVNLKDKAGAIDSVAVSVSVVPEPASWITAAVAVAGLILLAGRRRS